MDLCSATQTASSQAGKLTQRQGHKISGAIKSDSFAQENTFISLSVLFQCASTFNSASTLQASFVRITKMK